MIMACWFCFTGFGSSSMDYGMVGGKEAGTESRFKQWTMMEGLPSVASQDANMHKNGERIGCIGSALTVSSHQGWNSSGVTASS